MKTVLSFLFKVVMAILTVVKWLVVVLPMGIIKVIWNITEFIGKDVIAVEWKNGPWAVAMFFVPTLLVVLSYWGPLPGKLTMLAYLAGFVVIVLARISLSIARALHWRYHYYFVYEDSVRACKDAFLGLSAGVIPAAILFTIVWMNSSEMKAMKTRDESLRQAAVASGTLMSDSYGGIPKYQDGIVVNPPEITGKGSLMVMRVKMDNDAWSPRMMFVDPMECSTGCELPKPGDRVKVRSQFFRARTESWNAKPGQDVGIVMYFVEPVCK